MCTIILLKRVENWITSAITRKIRTQIDILMVVPLPLVFLFSMVVESIYPEQKSPLYLLVLSPLHSILSPMKSIHDCIHYTNYVNFAFYLLNHHPYQYVKKLYSYSHRNIQSRRAFLFEATIRLWPLSSMASSFSIWYQLRLKQRSRNRASSSKPR